MNFSKKDMDWDLEFHFLSLQTFVKQLFGRVSHLPLLTLDVVLNSKELSLLCFIFWQPDKTRFEPCVKLFTGKICLTWWIWWLPFSSLALSYTSKDSVWTCQSRVPVIVDSTVPTQSNCFTPLIFQLFSNQLWFPIYTLSHRCCLWNSQEISLSICWASGPMLEVDVLTPLEDCATSCHHRKRLDTF